MWPLRLKWTFDHRNNFFYLIPWPQKTLIAYIIYHSEIFGIFRQINYITYFFRPLGQKVLLIRPSKKWRWFWDTITLSKNIVKTALQGGGFLPGTMLQLKVHWPPRFLTQSLNFSTITAHILVQGKKPSPPLVGSFDYVFWQGHSVPKPPPFLWRPDLEHFLAQGSKKICYIVNLPKNTKNLRMINYICYKGFLGSRNQIKKLFW